jgi:hypothetical protein
MTYLEVVSCVIPERSRDSEYPTRVYRWQPAEFLKMAQHLMSSSFCGFRNLDTIFVKLVNLYKTLKVCVCGGYFSDWNFWMSILRQPGPPYNVEWHPGSVLTESDPCLIRMRLTFHGGCRVTTVYSSRPIHLLHIQSTRTLFYIT